MTRTGAVSIVCRRNSPKFEKPAEPASTAVVTPPSRLAFGSSPYGLPSYQWPWRSIRPGVTRQSGDILDAPAGRRRTRAGRFERHDPVALDREVERTVDALARVDDAATAQGRAIHRVLHSRSACRTIEPAAVPARIVPSHEVPHDDLFPLRGQDRRERARQRDARRRHADGARGRGCDVGSGRVLRPHRRSAGRRQRGHRGGDRGGGRLRHDRRGGGADARCRGDPGPARPGPDGAPPRHGRRAVRDRRPARATEMPTTTLSARPVHASSSSATRTAATTDEMDGLHRPGDGRRVLPGPARGARPADRRVRGDGPRPRPAGPRRCLDEPAPAHRPAPVHRRRRRPRRVQRRQDDRRARRHRGSWPVEPTCWRRSASSSRTWTSCRPPGPVARCSRPGSSPGRRRTGSGAR